ncbi:hypothetical protein MPSEU_000910700 [Mayamaea pseudoterrestris]|nr:hypothetical protein MPSEU_000910700 [Mayamaea pseudoterrestris]
MTATIRGSPTLFLEPTARFSVLHIHRDDLGAKVSVGKQEARRELLPHVPVIRLDDLLLHSHRSSTECVQEQLHHALSTQGFCLIVTSKHSQPARLVNELRTSLTRDLFPQDFQPATHLQQSESIYISERDVPMYRLGYELCEDNVRQQYRIAAGRPDEQPWPSIESRRIWLQSLGLMRHVTDAALELLLKREVQTRSQAASSSLPSMRSRPYSSASAWRNDRYASSNVHSLNDRPQDFSVLYAMHYFGRSLDDTNGIAVKQHVDPSLLVLEPFLCPNVCGLQVWDRTLQTWMDCDGPDSPMHAFPNEHVMLLFVGKGLQVHLPELEATLHRVVSSNGRARRTVIYEQKYGVFY